MVSGGNRVTRVVLFSESNGLPSQSASRRHPLEHHQGAVPSGSSVLREESGWSTSEFIFLHSRCIVSMSVMGPNLRSSGVVDYTEPCQLSVSKILTVCNIQVNIVTNVSPLAFVTTGIVHKYQESLVCLR